MSDQQKMMGLQMLQQRQQSMPQGIQQPSTAPGSLAAMEGRYVAPTGAGYQYYQGGSTATPFNPAALQAQLQQALAPKGPQQQQMAPQQNGITYSPLPQRLQRYFPNSPGIPVNPYSYQGPGQRISR